MTKDDIIRMAREAMRYTSIEPNDKVTFYVSYNNGIDADGFCDSVETFIERFANLVAATEREACAKVCDELVIHAKAKGDNDAMFAAVSCATAIRIRENNGQT